MPVVIGIALSIANEAFPSWITCLVLLFICVLMQSSVNTFNDYFDYVKGTDDESAEAQFPVGENYPEWMRRFALCLQWFGLFTAAGLLWYYYYKELPLDPEGMAPILQTGARHLLTAVLAALGVFGLVSIFALFGKLRGRSLACTLFGADLLVVSLWAIARQMIQNAQLKSYLDVSMIPQQVEWSPLIIFLIVFVIGAGVVVYLINKAVQANS